MTGTYPIHHMMIQLVPTRTLPDEIPTLSEIFQENGYGNCSKSSGFSFRKWIYLIEEQRLYFFSII